MKQINNYLKDLIDRLITQKETVIALEIARYRNWI